MFNKWKLCRETLTEVFPGDLRHRTDFQSVFAQQRYTNIVTGFLHTSIDHISFKANSDFYKPCFSAVSQSKKVFTNEGFIRSTQEKVRRLCYIILPLFMFPWWVCSCVPAFLHANTLQHRRVGVWTSERTSHAAPVWTAIHPLLRNRSY